VAPGEEKLPDAEVRVAREGDAARLELLAEEEVRDLREEADAVAAAGEGREGKGGGREGRGRPRGR
jgi:hypothetical protein